MPVNKYTFECGAIAYTQWEADRMAKKLKQPYKTIKLQPVS